MNNSLIATNGNSLAAQSASSLIARGLSQLLSMSGTKDLTLPQEQKFLANKKHGLHDSQLPTQGAAEEDDFVFFSPEQEQELLLILIDLFDAAIDLGAVSFDKAVAYIKNYIAENLNKRIADAIPFEILQAAYVAVTRKHKDAGTTKAKEVLSYENENQLKAENGIFTH